MIQNGQISTMYLKRRHPSFPTGHIFKHAQYYLYLRNAGPEEPVFIEVHVTPSKLPRMIFRMNDSLEASIWNHCGVEMSPREIKEWFAEHLRIDMRKHGEKIAMAVSIRPCYFDTCVELIPQPISRNEKRLVTAHGQTA